METRIDKVKYLIGYLAALFFFFQIWFPDALVAIFIITFAMMIYHSKD